MSDSESDDGDLKRAIALSLQDSPKHEVVDLLSDDDDEHEIVTSGMLESAKDRLDESDEAANKRCLKSRKNIRRPTNRTNSMFEKAFLRPQTLPSGVVATSNVPQLQPTSSSLMGLDRRKMEEERLARARKRKASLSPSSFTRKTSGIQNHPMFSFKNDEPVKEPMAKKRKSPSRPSLPPPKPTADSHGHQKLESVQLDAGSIRRKVLGAGVPALAILEEASSLNIGLHKSNSNSPKPTQPHILSYIQQRNLLLPGMHFPHGVVKKTWAYGYPRKDDIKIEEVLQKDDLEVAVLSAFQWDDEWIMRKVNLSKTKVICVVQAEGEMQKADMRANAPPNISFCFPLMAGQINCMHSKLQLLFHPSYLRIAIPSANLNAYDWGESGGIMENIVFMIDLPKHPNGEKTTNSSITPFGRELTYFLEAIEMENNVIENIMNFDFSQTVHMAFIHSIGGSHTGMDWKRTGYCGLGSAIRELGLNTNNALEIDYVSASIGSLNNNFTKSIYLAAQGDDGTVELNWRINRTSKNKSLKTPAEKDLGENEDQVTNDINKGFRIYFPSRETVEHSKGGIGAGGTICFQPKWYHAPTFPRALMRDCQSERLGLLMHSKLLFVRPDQPIRHIQGQDNIEYLAWAYIGSANLSESAWGRLVKDKSTKQPKLNIRNWECGVVIPVAQERSINMSSKTEVEDLGNDTYESVNFGANPTNMKVFDGRVPVPMIFPGEEYGVKRPWFYTEH